MSKKQPFRHARNNKQQKEIMAQNKIQQDWKEFITILQQNLMGQNIDHAQVENILETVLNEVKEKNIANPTSYILNRVAKLVKERGNKRYQNRIDLLFIGDLREFMVRVANSLYNQDFRKSEIEKVTGTPEDLKERFKDIWIEEFDPQDLVDHVTVVMLKSLKKKFTLEEDESLKSIFDAIVDTRTKALDAHSELLKQEREILNAEAPPIIELVKK